MILTDGEISDMIETKDLIVASTTLPLSIIIIGVGNETFANMVELDGDNGTLRDQNGRAASRDIVQFVKFLDFTGPNADQGLAEKVLQEVPEQLVSYMISKNIYPQGFKKVYWSNYCISLSVSYLKSYLSR